MKLTTKQRKTINDALYHLCLSRHDGIPTAAIGAILEPHGLHLEDGIYTGREGRCTEPVLTPDNSELENSLLVLSWCKGENTGTYEINSYLS